MGKYGSWELGAGSWELGAGSWELGAGSWEQNPKNKKPEATPLNHFGPLPTARTTPSL